VLSLSPNTPRPSEADTTAGRHAQVAANQQRLAAYHAILDTLCDQLESGRLHWRHYNSGVKILATLVRYDQRLPARAVDILLASLVHDSLEVRKAAVFAAGALLKQQKRRHRLVERAVSRPPPPVQPGNRSDNAWLEYRPENWPTDRDSWNKPNYVHKTHHGYYHWPTRMMVYAPEWDQPALDRQPEEMSAEERCFVQFFADPQRVDRLIALLSLEEHKGKDKFDPRKFILWKGLFRNYGDSCLAVLKPHLERLYAAPHESEQRCAAEMLAGLIRGSKHWTWDMTERLWVWLVPVLKNILGSVTVETM
jgi:proteasome activator subunit 4